MQSQICGVLIQKKIHLRCPRERHSIPPTELLNGHRSNLATRQLSSDEDLASGGNSQCFGADIQAKTSSSVRQSLFTVQLASWDSPGKIANSCNFFKGNCVIRLLKQFVSFSTQYTNINTFCGCFRSRRHFGQCVPPLSLPTRTVYLHATKACSCKLVFVFLLCCFMAFAILIVQHFGQLFLNVLYK